MSNQNAFGPYWLDIARKYLGEREIKGPRHNSKIVAWFKAIGAGWFKDDETPWCGAFVGGVLAEAGYPMPKGGLGARAKTWGSYGVKLDRPAVGCIAVKNRVGGGHVTFIVGQDKRGNLLGLGGNQGDMVKVSTFAPHVFTDFRWPGIRPYEFRYDLPVLTSAGAFPDSEA